MFSTDRQTHRRIFLEAWRKAKAQAPLGPIESQIVELMRRHPEYWPFLEDGTRALDQDFPPELGQTNPFLHLGLHLAILEQLSIDQPRGIRERYQRLLTHLGDPHQVEHAIMECLAESLWRVQHQRLPFDEAGYLDCIDHREVRA
ncbi:DUF1841 family protein [Thermochromatium tepidum]|uniref:DUF1841 family protein n=1 Tax=Thermochromatium tepidum ATCC 43061 TaxID=316276 RepID=A0A6I6DXT9_THETI|nr:DUF1841 family protein [Thermochromatium tepidum]QGU32401.1 DUF1841 family protein [Thermochromatium tepidum ATCC 43061]